MEILELQKTINADSHKKGYWQNEIAAHDNPPVKEAFISQKLCLVHSEVSEALEARRKQKFSDMTGAFNREHPNYLGESNWWYEDHIKHTFEEELADTAIRLFDLAYQLGVDLEWHMLRKMKYNESHETKKKF